MAKATDAVKLRAIRLRKREERRLLGGHLWIYSNEVDVDATPLKDFEPGESVEILTAGGEFLASGYVNPHSLICARILSRDRARPPGVELLRQRLADALALRQRLYDAPWYRLAHGEGDGLPGLIVDRYGDVLVAQITTAGMERMKDEIVAALQELLAPRAILWQNTSEVRTLEGLDRYTEPAAGAVPEAVVLPEHGAQFRVPLQRGQKTGWFFDQRENRARLLPLVRGRRVLDVCAYLGAWGIEAAVHGARDVLCVDSSAPAIDGVRHNAELNGVAVRALHADAFEGLRALREAGERFDVVVLDPPAFIKRRKDVAEGRVAYQRLNELGLALLDAGGLFVSCSCSFHMSEADLVAVAQRAAARAGRFLRLLAAGAQAADHPVHPAIPETRYLKSLLLHAS
jgi:23S rRNA (cytosine1962-C5)-methyltransferase